MNDNRDEWTKLTPDESGDEIAKAYYTRADRDTLPNVIQAGCEVVALSDIETRALIRAAFPITPREWTPEAVRALRGGMSQFEFSKRLGLKRTIISHWETGFRVVRPSMGLLLSLAELHGIFD